MMKIGIYDTNFMGCGPSVGTGRTDIAPSKIEWDFTSSYNKIKFFTDNCFDQSFVDMNRGEYNFAWFLEPYDISPQIYSKIDDENFRNNFDLILTHNMYYVRKYHNVRWVPFGGTWVRNWNIYKKTKNISIIASNKRQTKGHLFRHEIISKYSNTIEGVFGLGYKKILEKEEGLNDYAFSFAIENCDIDLFFTEKLIDCFLTGTIPIYYGSDKILDIFDGGGIIKISNIDDVDMVVNDLTLDYYLDRIGCVENNFELAKNFAIPEDWIFDNILMEYV